MKIIDLFSGAGGLTFGFYYKKEGNKFVRRENIEFVFSNEYNESAAAAHRLNYENANMIQASISDITSERIKELIGNEEVDVIIGGPPCQSFSTIGQRRYDERAKLSEEYLRVLEVVRPKMFLFENVKGILSMKEIFYKQDEEGNTIYKVETVSKGGREYVRREPIVEDVGELVIEKLKKEFKRMGYTIEPRTLNAYDYGVPQNRERVVIIGVRDDLGISLAFPEKQKNTLTIEDAISDLPVVLEGEEQTKYLRQPDNEYQILMRGDTERITQHFCGVYGDKIRTVIKNVAEGEGKNDFNKKVDDGVVDKKYYLTSGFGNTYGRLRRNKPSPTITNNLSTPSSSRCIHYEQDRALTPREGARIQSFPDWFEFVGDKAQVVKQIGNAVPPLLAIALADQIMKIL